MIILCLNCGSSSVKYRLYDWNKKETIATGIVERVTTRGSFCIQEVTGQNSVRVERECPTHREAIKLIIEMLTSTKDGVIKDLKVISAVGHRVVHGGERFAKSIIITEEVLDEFKKLADLAPLHNPPNILGIEAAKELLPNVPHMAIMDTAWHQTMPKY
ncbi:MAG: propionate kinase, partial [Candidatus Marinimicrobia bacterium]|nr:propionate kinase [Candidatus Neomarinimicrobiota bacterium]